MPRDLPFGNNSLLMNLDRVYPLRRLCCVPMGMENHTRGTVVGGFAGRVPDAA